MRWSKSLLCIPLLFVAGCAILSDSQIRKGLGDVPPVGKLVPCEALEEQYPELTSAAAEAHRALGDVQVLVCAGYVGPTFVVLHREQKDRAGYAVLLIRAHGFTKEGVRERFTQYGFAKAQRLLASNPDSAGWVAVTLRTEEFNGIETSIIGVEFNDALGKIILSSFSLLGGRQKIESNLGAIAVVDGPQPNTFLVFFARLGDMYFIEDISEIFNYIGFKEPIGVRMIHSPS